MIEHHYVPEEYQRHLTLIGGTNLFDEPNFRLAWAQTETAVRGGTWSVDEATFTGYRRMLVGSGEPCWMLMQWHDPSEYGTPIGYYLQNYDEPSRLQILGEYPYQGRYEVLYHLRWQEFENGKLTLHTIPLAYWILDLIVPIILAARSVSFEKRKAAVQEAQARVEEEKLRDVERGLRDSALPFRDAVSFGRQGIRSTVIDQQVLRMQQNWNELQAAARKFYSRKGQWTE